MGLRDLPSVDALADQLQSPLPRAVVVEAARNALDRARQTLTDGAEAANPKEMATEELEKLAGLKSRRVINATGVLLHTNLGRAPWHQSAADAAVASAVGYDPVEMDLGAEQRGGRGAYAANLISAYTGAQAALVVNNNAGALLLALAALVGNGGVLVSRGELIEIGGSFRLPELMAASGADLIEVGTTNRTRLSDYQAAVDGAGLILKVHPSNYRIEGFAEEASYRELGELAARHNLPFVADVGSGLLDARVPWLDHAPPDWLAEEPGVRQTIETGADVVLFSGDKVMGGPQAGIAVGTSDAIETMRRHPLARALRCDGPTLAALEATIELYSEGRGAEIPFWAMTSIPYEELELRSKDVITRAGVAAELDSGRSVPGAGSVPGRGMSSPVIRVPGDADELWRRLLHYEPPIVARRADGELTIDLRAVDPTDDASVSAAMAEACR